MLRSTFRWMTGSANMEEQSNTSTSTSESVVDKKNDTPITPDAVEVPKKSFYSLILLKRFVKTIYELNTFRMK